MKQRKLEQIIHSITLSVVCDKRCGDRASIGPDSAVVDVAIHPTSLVVIVVVVVDIDDVAVFVFVVVVVVVETLVVDVDDVVV